MRDWVTNVRTTHYLLGSVLGAHPYPTMVRDFHKITGREARAQILKAEKKLPTAIVACVGGGSNAIGIFYEFLKDKKVGLVGVGAGGRSNKLGDHAPASRVGHREYCRYVLLRPARQCGANCAHPLSLRRPGLPIDRPRACMAERYGPRRIHLRLRRRSAGSHDGTCPHKE